MAGPEASVPYTPYPQVEPTTGSPNDYLSVRADPTSFGSQVGAAQIQQGQALDKIGNDATDIAVQRQGMLNETMATNADTQLAAEHGKIMGAYKSMEGLQAVGQTDRTVAAVQQARLNIRATLPNAAAQRAFDLFAARREAYTVGDINNYSATQLKAADTRSATDALSSTIQEYSDPSKAFDDSQIKFGIGEIKSQIPRIITNQGYGQDSGTGMTQDQNGDLSFADTNPGHQAKAVTDQYTSKALGEYWDTILRTQSTDATNGSVTKASDTLQKYKDQIPAETYAKWSSQFNTGLRNEQARTGADTLISQMDQGYQDHFTSAQPSPLGTSPSTRITTLFPGAVVTSKGRTPEHNAEVGGVPDSMHLSNQAIDFVLPKDMTFADVQSKLTQQGIKPTELLNEGDHIHLGWAPKDQTGQPSSSGYTSKADYYRQNYADTIQQARIEAEKLHPGDSAFADAYASRTEQRMSNVITQQGLQDRVYQDTVMGATLGDSKHPPITSVDQLENNPDPNVRDAWAKFSFQNPIAASNLQNRLITANSRGAAQGYGVEFDKSLFDTLGGNVSDTTSLLGNIKPEAGKDSPLTNSGYSALIQEHKNMNTPQGQAFAQAELGFLQKMKTQLDPANDGVGQQKFNSFLQQILPEIQNGRGQNKTPGDLFEEKSPDYVGKTANSFGRTDKQIFEDSQKSGAPGNTSVKASWSAPYDTIKDADSGNFALLKDARNIKDPEKNLAFRRQARAYAIKRGWVFEAPSVPRPQ